MSEKGIALLKQLRDTTGAGMLDCKSALKESDNDLDKAAQVLKKKGLLIGVLRGGKETNQGVITASTTKDTPNSTPGEFGVIMCLSCETDFVAKSDNFIHAATEIALYAVENKPANLEELQKDVEDVIATLMSSIKESIKLSYYYLLEGDHIYIYNHHNNKLGVLVSFNKKVDEEVGKNIAMQIAGLRPIFVDNDDIPEAILTLETKLSKEKVLEDESMKGKSQETIDKIVEGRVRKATIAMTLLNQEYTKAEKKETVRQYLKSIDKELIVLSFSSYEMQ